MKATQCINLMAHLLAGHESAFAFPAFDQPIPIELLERQPHGDATDCEACHNLRFPREPSGRLVGAFGDLGTKPIGDLQRRCSGMDASALRSSLH